MRYRKRIAGVDMHNSVSCRAKGPHTLGVHLELLGKALAELLSQLYFVDILHGYQTTYHEKLSQGEPELLASFGYASAEPKRAP